MQFIALLIAAHICTQALIAAEVEPANTVVVINAASTRSTEVAHAWMQLRGIPEHQAIALNDIPAGAQISLSDFRQKILGVIEHELTQRKLEGRIALVVYAPDLPLAVTFDDTGREAFARSPGSITGMTLLAPLLANGSAAYTALDANPYAERIRVLGSDLNIKAAKDPRSQVDMTTNREVALTALASLAAEIPAPNVLYNLACMQALLGHLDDAESTLEKAITAGWMNILHSAKDPDLTALRTRPAWAGLIARMQATQTRELAAVRPETSARFQPTPGVDGGPPGRLAMVLAPGGERGFDTGLAIAGLSRSVAADGSNPHGTFWFMNSNDVDRTSPRSWAFTGAAAALVELGKLAEVRDGILPPDGSQVAGAVIGAATFDWPASHATMLAGAWCDHLTSLGGVLDRDSGQTPLSAFLLAGAAGAGGTVHEPLNVANKFPSAFLHVHRVRGLTLVEAVHRTMSAPYQYLAVGDPLSRPWK